MSYFGDIENTSTRKYVYTATGSETSVTVADSGSTIAYRPGEVDVYKNGVKLISGSDYSAIGDGITDLTALSLNDVIEVIAYDYRKTGEGLVKLTDSNNWGATQNFPDGTEANPSISFTQDTDTGFYRKDDDTLGVSGSLYSIGDVSAASINNGQVGGFRNVIINGDFNIWQRGTSLSAGTGPRYLADRWFSFSTGSTIAPSRQEFVLCQTDVPNNPRYYHRCVVSSVTGAGNTALLIQDIEGVHVLSGGGQQFLVFGQNPLLLTILL